MRSFQILEFGIENLREVDIPEPQVEADQVKIKFHSCSINYRDHLMISGLYDPRQKLPLIPLSDGAGEVVETGDSVSRFKVGDKVTPVFAQNWIKGPPQKETLRHSLGGPLPGTLCEYGVFSEEGVVKIPEHLNYDEAAALPCAALTAWNAVVTYGNIKPGGSILVLGSGGVSVFALQIAKLKGAKVIATSAKKNKLNKLRELGADHVINYNENAEWHKEVLRLTNREGVDIVIEVGGADTLERSLSCVRLGGVIGLIGVLSGGETKINLRSIFMRNICVQGIIVGNRNQFEEMNHFIEKTELRPVVGEIFSFKNSKQAIQTLIDQKHFGKVCISI